LAVDVDVIVAPVASAAPIISTLSPISKGVAGAKRESGRDESSGDISGISEIVWGIFRVRPCTVDDARIVIRHIDRFGVRRLNRDDLLALLLSLGDLLLLGRSQLVVGVGLCA
jgi:hypothetical protein